MSRIASAVVAASIACASWPVFAAAPVKVRLEIDTSALPESSATSVFAQWLAQDQTRTILDGGLEVSPTAPIIIRRPSGATVLEVAVTRPRSCSSMSTGTWCTRSERSGASCAPMASSSTR